MRLLHAGTLEFLEFEGMNIPDYAILSHRWEEGEVTYEDMKHGPLAHARGKHGFDKIQQCCQLALADGLTFAWIDTCCIDKTSSAELSEAINSMYQWYQRSVVCYAYLSDVYVEIPGDNVDATGTPNPILKDNDNATKYTDKAPDNHDDGTERLTGTPKDNNDAPPHLVELPDDNNDVIEDLPETPLKNGDATEHTAQVSDEHNTGLKDLMESIDNHDNAGDSSVLVASFEKSQMLDSKWWKRGWTLQELIAPRLIKFYGKGRNKWQLFGDKTSLADLVTYRTGIPRAVLNGQDVKRCSVAMRMSWASDRETTRIEDTAYCLLGIFGVNMPLLYGEGERAFLRLQEEIMKQSDDQTLFAWELRQSDSKAEMCGPLATSPSRFHGCSELLPIPDSDVPTPYSMTNKGLRIELPIVKHKYKRKGIAILQCSTTTAFPRRITLPIILVHQEEHSHFARDGRYTYALKTAKLDEIDEAVTRTIFMRQEPEQGLGWQTKFLVCGRNMLWPKYYRSYYSPKLVETNTKIEKKNAFTIPSGYRRGAIFYAGDGPDVLVLYSIEMQHRGRFSCKILRANPSSKSLSASSQYVRIQKLLSDLKSNIVNYNAPAAVHNHIYVANIERRLLELHNYYTTGSDSRTSFTDLPEDGAVYVNIAPRIVRGQSTLVLDIDLRKRSDGLWPLHEIYGDEAKAIEDGKAEDSEVMRGVEETELDENI